MFLTIIIPAYNEESTLEAIVDKLRSVQMPDFLTRIEYLIIDDCSKDKTGEIAQSLADKFPDEITYFKQEKNTGKGGAVHTGFAKAQGDVFLIQDADLEYDPDDIPKLLVAMKELDILLVNGSRYMPGPIRYAFSYNRFFFNRFFTWMVSVVTNTRLTDMACCYKLISKELLQHLNLKERGFGLECELMIKTIRSKKTQVAEVPVQYYPRSEWEGKKLKNKDALRIFWCIIKYGLFRGK